MKKFMFISVLFSGLCLLFCGCAEGRTTCFGTNNGFSMSADRMEQYSRMWREYANCTVVEGNLEITGLEWQGLDLSFLQNIEEITGYLLIGLNYVKTLSFDKLRIIRGRQLYRDQYALMVTLNYNTKDSTKGLQHLKMHKLTEIVRGSILVRQNPLLCNADTVDWLDIINNASRKSGNWSVDVQSNAPKSTCSPCHPSCNGYCWSEGADMCQTRTNTICSEFCAGTRCRGPGRDECCDKECAVGCHGPRNDQCTVCLHVNNSGTCELQCPPKYIYDSATNRNVQNPAFRYNHNDQCVDECPGNLLAELGNCVRTCTRGYGDDGNGKCVPCTNEACEKECDGIGLRDGLLADEETVNAFNVGNFSGCKIINGNLIFQSYVFNGDGHTGLPPLTSRQVIDAFKTVKKITGYLQITAWAPDLHDFSAFQNLEEIGGAFLFRGLASIVIQDSIVQNGPHYLNQITSLGFNSLKKIRHGNVYLGYMQELCYDRLVDWSSLLQKPKVHRSFVNGVMLRRNKANCSSVQCDPTCSSRGCWGPGPSNCLDCENHSFRGVCVEECSQELGVYGVDESNMECLPCDKECRLTCHGPGPHNCDECKHYKDGDKCVDECPINKWHDHVTGTCQPCHSACQLFQGERMCAGPNNIFGDGGCNHCEYVEPSKTSDSLVCLGRDADSFSEDGRQKSEN